MGGLLLLALGFYQNPTPENRTEPAPETAALLHGAPSANPPVAPAANFPKQKHTLFAAPPQSSGISSRAAQSPAFRQTVATPVSPETALRPVPVPSVANANRGPRQLPAAATASINSADLSQSTASTMAPSQSPLAGPGNAAADALSPITPAPDPAAPDQSNSPSTSSDLPWRLMAQLAVQNTNAAIVLIQNATQHQIPDDAWQAIAGTLVGETIQGGLIVSLDPTALATTATQEGHQRLDLIESLLASAPEAARDPLRNSLTWLSQQLSSRSR
ncbi:MAG: hypothetical protein C5B50_06830 [Verrucomicrobia bacterium]|nr:MAG: hypothetical protein C5B50_06830 [Verrucomicrobiota bacterium]